MTLHAAHDDILATAEKLFARHAYAEVSLRQLIAASKLSTTAFYARFDSKDAVLDTLAARLFTELAAGATAALRGAPDLAAGIDAGVALLVAHFVPRKALVRLVVTEAGGAVDPARSLRRASYAMLAAFLAKRLGCARAQAPDRGRRSARARVGARRRARDPDRALGGLGRARRRRPACRAARDRARDLAQGADMTRLLLAAIACAACGAPADAPATTIRLVASDAVPAYGDAPFPTDAAARRRSPRRARPGSNAIAANRPISSRRTSPRSTASACARSSSCSSTAATSTRRR